MLKVETKKDKSLVSWTFKHPKLYNQVRLPLMQASGSRATATVNVGDKVRVGQKIAEPIDDFSVPVHASISGEVTAIDQFSHPLLESARAIEITSDDKSEKEPWLGEERSGWETLDPESVIGSLREAAVVNLAEDGLPLHVTLQQERGVKTLVINACESEPYVTCDHSLMLSHPVEILKGAEIIRKALDAENVIIAISDNKLEPAEFLRSKIFFLQWPHFEVRILKTSYPRGDKSVLLRELFGHKVRGRGKYRTQPATAELGVAVYNVATFFAVYEAIVLQKPLIERGITVSGECVIEPRNMWVPIGMSLWETVQLARGLMREPRKVIVGGPMRGAAQSTLEVPVVPTARAILALPKEVTKPYDTEACTRCGDCLSVCPEDINPAMITLAAERDLIELAGEWGAQECIECGNCAHTCPSKIPLVDMIRYAASVLELSANEPVLSSPATQPYMIEQVTKQPQI